jgi:hypothetical protein
MKAISPYHIPERYFLYLASTNRDGDRSTYCREATGSGRGALRCLRRILLSEIRRGMLQCTVTIQKHPDGRIVRMSLKSLLQEMSPP